MEIVKELRKDLFLVTFSEEEVDFIYTYVNLDDVGIEVLVGDNVLELKTLDYIYSRLSRLQHFDRDGYIVYETLHYFIEAQLELDNL